MRLVRFFAFLALAGCANHPLDCATGLVAWADCKQGTAGYEKFQSAIGRDDELCKSYGLDFGTDAYASCRVALRGQSEARKQAIISAYYNQRGRANPTPRTDITCETRAVGDTRTTTCK